MKLVFKILPLAILVASAAHADAVLPKFDPAAFEPGAAATHPYFTLQEGWLREFSGMTTEDGKQVEERAVMAFGGAGPELAGVQTVMVVHQAYLGGLLVELARDFYAQDRDGNVWYMGEDVTNVQYDADGKVESTDSKGSWRAGANGALPGYQMPADLTAGFAFEQEHAPADAALDIGEIMTVDGTLQGPTGNYDHVLAVFETSTVEPALREIKYYAPGVGLIGEDEAVDANRANPEAHFGLIRKAN